jgi:hypothetical protein
MVDSQPKGVDLLDLKGYDYICKAGRGVTIYVLDSGADLSNPVCISFFFGY